MSLTITDQIPQEISAYLINQRYAARSAVSRIGSKNFFNCLGVVIHNSRGHVGAVGHIEAPKDLGTYNDVANASIATMLNDLIGNGGNIGDISLVLMGNFTKSVEVNLQMVRRQLIRLDFYDQRPKMGACALDPVQGVLYLESYWDKIYHENLPDVHQIQLQEAELA
jgi:hypothetical protein